MTLYRQPTSCIVRIYNSFPCQARLASRLERSSKTGLCSMSRWRLTTSILTRQHIAPSCHFCYSPKSSTTRRMDDISSTLAGVRRRLVDLRTFQLSRLASCRGPLDLHRELAEEMRSDLESVRSRLEVRP